MKTFNWPVVAGVVFCLIFWAVVAWIGFHVEKKPVYNVSVIHEYYIIESYTVNDLNDTVHYPDSYLIIHKIQ